MTLNTILLISLFLLLLISIKLLTQLSKSYYCLLEIKNQLWVIVENKQETIFKQVELKEKLKLAEEVVDKGSSTVENVHKAISGITFDVLKNIPITKSTAKIVSDIHDTTSKGVYNTIRSINKQIGKMANDMLPPNDDTTTPPSNKPDDKL